MIANTPGQAVLYARISPRPEENESVAMQLDLLRADCTKRGEHILGEFQDVLKSGGEMKNRPGFLEAIEVATSKQAVLAVYSLSRFARNLGQAASTYERLERSGAKLRALTGFQVDTSTPQGWMIFHQMLLIDDYFRRDNAAKTRGAMLHHQAKGRRMSAIPPYGYQRDPDDDARLIEDPAEFPAIAEAVKLRAEGNSLSEIARRLGRTGYPPRGECWNHSCVRSILRRAGG